ncbi:MAG: monovalent cation/H(+) antiporter subunit G [Henriciella sp.]|nr:monovalent cation/H(+) antiporter subunit G [Henriciella sp.]
MTEIMGILMQIKPVLGAFLCLVGGVLAIIGTVGVLRFPDFYSRLHAASVIDTSAATLAIIGMMLLAPTWLIVFKLGVVWLFLFLTGPTSSHALANAAHTAGVEPLIGRRNGDDEGADS